MNTYCFLSFLLKCNVLLIVINSNNIILITYIHNNITNHIINKTRNEGYRKWNNNSNNNNNNTLNTHHIPPTERNMKLNVDSVNNNKYVNYLL